MIFVAPELSSWNLTNDHSNKNGTQEPNLQISGLRPDFRQGTGMHNYLGQMITCMWSFPHQPLCNAETSELVVFIDPGQWHSYVHKGQEHLTALHRRRSCLRPDVAEPKAARMGVCKQELQHSACCLQSAVCLSHITIIPMSSLEIQLYAHGLPESH